MDDTPLILDAKGEILFFKTAASLESYVEAIDVDNGEYGECWDSAGRLMRLRTERHPLAGGLGSRETARLEAADSEANQEPILRRTLAAFLVGLGERSSELESLSTIELVHLGAQRAGWS
jgi:hypothetical protein